MNVELIYDRDRPNVAQTRASLVKAFTIAGISARWREWERSDRDAPPYVGRYGSPTILVNNADVAGVAPHERTASCRIYLDTDGKLIRTPPLHAICSALRTAAADPQGQAKPARGLAATAGAAGVVLMPKLICPLCFPAYAAVLSAIGLEFFDYTPYLFPIATTFLCIVVALLSIQAKRSGKYLPFALGVAASVAVLLGKFIWDNIWLTAAGLAMLLAAVVLSGRVKQVRGAPCPACIVEGKHTGLTKERHHV